MTTNTSQDKIFNMFLDDIKTLPKMSKVFSNDEKEKKKKKKADKKKNGYLLQVTAFDEKFKKGNDPKRNKNNQSNFVSGLRLSEVYSKSNYSSQNNG